MFHIGDITMDVGNAFACSPESNWKTRREFTKSGISVMRAEAAYDKLVNREARRDVNDSANFIYFHVPVTAWNIEYLTADKISSINFNAEINQERVWSASADIKILEPLDNEPTAQAPTVKSIVI